MAVRTVLIICLYGKNTDYHHSFHSDYVGFIFHWNTFNEVNTVFSITEFLEILTILL